MEKEEEMVHCTDEGEMETVLILEGLRRVFRLVYDRNTIMSYGFVTRLIGRK